MRYDVEKLIDILILFAKKDQILTKLRIAKLLYFVDKYHLRKYGRFILDDRYHRLQHGPIPSLTLNLINDFFSPPMSFGGKRIENPLTGFFQPDEDQYRHEILLLKKDADLGALSESEREAVAYVLAKYGNLSTSRLVSISHKEKTWQETTQPNEIDIELFLDGMPVERKEVVKGLIELDKEDEYFDFILNS